MAKFLTTKSSSSSIERIINNAERRVVLISPFIKIDDPLFRCLKDANKKRVNIIVLYGKKKELESNIKERLSTLDCLILRFLENVHAKCFYNESEMVITSLNLYDFSEVNNEEMGVLLTRTEDESAFLEAVHNAESLVNHSEPIKTRASFLEQVTKEVKSLTDSMGLNTSKGFCIRCGTSIDFDMDKVLCDNCYDKWAKYKAPNYKEKFCHKCGKSVAVTKAKPLCRSCFKEE